MTKCLLVNFTDKEPLLALVKTGILMVIMTFIVTLLGSLLGGFQGMIIAVLFAGTMNIFAWYKSDSLVLRIYKAKLAPKQSELSKIVRSLSRKAKMPIPKVFIIDNSQPNAFATGRNPENSSVANFQLPENGYNRVVRWTSQEINNLKLGMSLFGDQAWRKIQRFLIQRDSDNRRSK